MEDANMSQSAEQTATGNVPPSGQAGVKRQFSAETFRALTQRLKNQQASDAVPPVDHHPEPETPSRSGNEPADIPAPEPTTPAPDTSQLTPFQEPAIAPVVDAPVPPAPETVVEEVRKTEADESLAQDLAISGVDVKTEQLPVSEVEMPAPEILASEIPASEIPVPEIPVKGTTIFLSTAKNVEPVTPAQMVEQERVKTPETFQSDDVDNEIGDGQAAALEPVTATIDPLQAAMDLVRVDDPMPGVDEITPAKDINPAAQANSQLPEKPPVKDSLVLSGDEDVVGVAKKPVKGPPEVGESNEVQIEQEPDAESGETAKTLLDIMSSGSQPQERALAADTLLRLVPRMMVKDLIALSDRVCMMADAPPLLVKALINHREAKVASPLLEDGKTISEQDLLRLAATTDVDRLIMMAKHRAVSQTVCDALIARGEPSVYLTLLRNPGAALSHDAFVAFNEIAKSQPSLQAPMATRGDTPPPIAFELFWSLPVELRRYVLSRFLTDSATLDKILKITKSVDGGTDGEHKFPPKRKVEALIELIADGVTDQAVTMMAELAGINQDNARRIIADPDGEPLTVVLKTMGQTRAQFSQAIKKCANSSKPMLRGDRDLSELQIMFDSLSFNKARTLLTYWDWAIEKSGPYTRRVM